VEGKAENPAISEISDNVGKQWAGISFWDIHPRRREAAQNTPLADCLKRWKT